MDVRFLIFIFLFLSLPVEGTNYLWRYDTYGEVVSVSTNGEYILAGTRDGLFFLDKEKNLLWRYDLLNVKSVALSGDGKCAAAASGNNVYLFSQAGRMMWRFGFQNRIEDVSVSYFCNLIAFGAGGFVNLISNEARPLGKYDTGSVVSSISISPDGNYTAAGTNNWVYFFRKMNLLWKTDIAKMALLLKAPNVLSIATTGKKTVAGASDSRIYLLDEEGKWRRFEAPDKVTGVSISEYGIAAASSNKILYYNIWGELKWSYSAASDVTSVSLSPDGRYLAAGSKDNNIYFIDVSSFLPTYISVKSEPSGKVHVDGKFAGYTPINVSVKEGIHTLRISHGSYGEIVQRVKVIAGESVSVEIDFKNLLPLSVISIHSSPERAAVYLEGESVGETPLNISVVPAIYAIKVEKKGYEGWSGSVEAKKGKIKFLNITLQETSSTATSEEREITEDTGGVGIIRVVTPTPVPRTPTPPEEYPGFGFFLAIVSFLIFILRR
jgi:hypothetical protein